MANALDRSLDEILADRKQSGRGRGNRGSQRRDRQDYPRDGVRKSFRDEAPRNLDSEWVHDRFEEGGSRRSSQRRRHSPDASTESRGTKIRVDNIHYELTQEDLEGLFEKIGPITKLEMKYDRAGRSEGTAFVTYESHQDAKKAIQEFDGANAAGQPIRMTLLPSGPRRNPFDTAVVPGRPLAERITVPGRRSRSLSPRRDLDDEAARKGIDRYRPGGRGSRSRSPLPNRRREDGRRPGARREGGGRRGRGGGRGGERGEGGERPARDGRLKKTQEELDAEMEDYFNGSGAEPSGSGANSGAAASAANGDDIDMGIE
jgi:THO complex subunit 4